MDLHVSLTEGRNLAGQVYGQVRAAIAEGRMRPGDRLPPTREFAARLAVSRNTVATAYDRLTAEGFLVSRVGSGTYVSGAVGPVRAAARAPRGVLPGPRWHGRRPTPAAAPARYDLGVGVPDPAFFPYENWRRLIARELRRSKAPGPGYADPFGHPALRAAIARHIGLSRSVRADPGDVLATQGAQQAVDLVARVLVEPGTRVAVEDPGYPPARELFALHGAEIAPVPVDGEGIDVAAIPARTRVVYVTPSHQFPLGTAMSLRRREELLAWAERHDAVIVEDDYDSEYRYADRPLEPLQSLDRGGRTVYVGSFSKVLSPLLRCGFLVAPRGLRDALAVVRRLTDWHGDPWSQAALAGFIDEGLLARHVRRTGRAYERRWRRITAALPGLVPSAAGLHVSCLLPGDVPDTEAVAAAERAGVHVHALSRYTAGAAPRNGLVVGFGAVAEDDLDAALDSLLGALDAVRGR